GRFSAAKIEHQPRCNLQPVLDKSRVEPALKAVPGIALNVELAAGGGGADRIEQRRLDVDFCCFLGAASRLAADHAAQALDTVGVGDHGDLRVERVFLAVQRQQGFARPRKADSEVAL